MHLEFDGCCLPVAADPRRRPTGALKEPSSLAEPRLWSVGGTYQRECGLAVPRGAAARYPRAGLNETPLFSRG